MAESTPNLEAKPIRPGVAVLAIYQGQLLLGKRQKEPNRGLWVPPGGGTKEGESPEQTAMRELLEEANAKITVGKKVYHLSIDEPELVRQIDYYEAELVSDPSELKGSDDLADPRLFNKAEIAALGDAISPAVVEVLQATNWL